jgi:hypothetical protein
VFGDVGVRTKAWVEELELLDSYEEGRGLSEEEKERRRGGEGWLRSWRLLFYKRKFVGDRNLGSGGSRRVTSALNSFIR